MATSERRWATGTSVLVVGWRDAERRLYPLVLSDPDRYEYSLKLVRAVADEMGAVNNTEDLAIWFDRRVALVARAIANVGASIGQVDMDAVVGAAFALRYAEVQAEVARAEALRRVSAARYEGMTWTTLYESGVNTAAGAVLAPYDLLEACLVAPWGLHSSVRYDVETNAIVYHVEVANVDVESARWWVDDASPIAERTHEDVECWEASRAELRELLLRRPAADRPGAT